MSRQVIFERIYRTNAWHGDETRAGLGSSLIATSELKSELPGLCAEMGITSVLDAGCNEALWQPELPGYIGMDIVPRAIAEARKRHPDRAFVVGDICADALPQVDAVLCRDVLQHLSTEDVHAALANFRRSATWLIASSWYDGDTRGEWVRANRGTQTGRFQAVDLAIAPFFMGKPLRSIPDGAWWRVNGSVKKIADLHLGVWRLR